MYNPDRKDNLLDIYTAPDSKATLFYVHGGGYVLDDKSNREDYLYRFVSEGYNVVNVNYELSPDMRYPGGLEQVNNALAYVFDNADEYGIDPNKIFLSGDSAGGHATAQLSALLTNPDYASEFDFKPANINNDMKPLGYIAVGALFDPATGDDTGFFLTDWLFGACFRSYFDVVNIEDSSDVSQASMYENINKDFPPTFSSDGNFGSFTSQAIEFNKRLVDMGVEAELLLFDRSESTLIHVFELNVEDHFANQVHQAQLSFMENRIG
ncbi:MULTISPECIES: alpha/beta hydrolase [unclassified Corynebacterium]|uniref:alpha/beta hydrolase n=1 Tax=unclassified Corynebacterium TaxID=2624378 RepID=UPI0029C9C3DC|nr:MULTISPECIES: alpha/beta hydrolase [unclassified Corynebacterium]WPF66120.1 alpha/beta hydrolase [Corynebacterium sp. 22KM0430]WPF68612.1 alpha/beta hydrolase [Corynebacterium sp. 21KM1197]